MPRGRNALGFFAGVALLAAASVTAGAASAAPRGAASAVSATAAYGEIVVTDGAAIRIYAPGATGNVAPVRTITGPNTLLGLAFGVALDGAGNIWVVDYGNVQIEEFAANATGDVAPLRVFTATSPDISQPEGIALDPADKLVWIGNFNSNLMPAFGGGASGTTTPSRRINIESSGGTFTNDIAMSPDSRHLWTTDVNSHSVREYSPTGAETQPTQRVLALGAGSHPQGVAVDMYGIVRVSDSTANAIYAYGPASDDVPLSSITGSNTGIDQPGFISFDARRDLWAAIRGSGGNASVEEFGPNAHGNVAPIRRIAGTATQLVSPRDVAVYGAKPSAPRSLKAVGARRQVSLTWRAPASTGGGLLGYALRRKSSPHGKWVVIAGTSKRAYVDTRRTLHHRYFYDLIAVNNYGNSTASATESAVAEKPKPRKHHH